MANFTAAINALVAERDRVFLVSVSERFNLPFEQLSKLYLETAEQAIKVPRKYTKKPKAVAVVAEGEAVQGVSVAPAPAKEPKAKADKQKCTACTSKKEPCKFSALKGEVFCKRHLRASQEANGAQPEQPAAKPAKKAAQPVHTHELTQQPAEPCELCESHGNPLADEAEFEVVLPSPQPTLTVAERLAALLEASDSESDSESDAEDFGLMEEAFEDE